MALLYAVPYAFTVSFRFTAFIASNGVARPTLCCVEVRAAWPKNTFSIISQDIAVT